MLRLLASLVLLGLVGAGLYYWKGQPGAAAPRSLGEAQRQLEDVATTAAVKTALSLHRSLRPYTVSVQTENGIVTRPAAAVAQLARDRGVAAALRRWQVCNIEGERCGAAAATEAGDDRSIGERLDDEALEVQLRLAFSLDRNLKDSGIEVESRKRQVRLSGTLRSAEQKRLALQTASDVAGASNVIDALALAGESRRGGRARRRPEGAADEPEPEARGDQRAPRR